MAAPSPDAAYPSALCRAPGARALLRLLLGTAFSASSKSDFQQATRHSGQRTARAAIASRRSCPTCRGSEMRRYFWSFAATRTASSGSASCAATPTRTASSKGFSTPRSTRRWSCRPLSWRPKPRVSGAVRSASFAIMPTRSPRYWSLPDKVFPVAGLCVGYPAAAGHVSMRLPLEVTVHIDHYDDRHARRSRRRLRPAP